MKREDMRRKKISIIFLAVSLIALFIFSSSAIAIASEGDENTSSNLEQKFQKKLDTINIPFIQNQGQIDNDKVKFYANIFAGAIFVTEDYLTYGIIDEKKSDQETISSGYVFNEKFLNANGLLPEGRDKFQSNISFFKGDEENWKSNVPSYNKLEFREVWNNISVELRAYGGNMEKLFYVSPIGNTNDIQMQFEGIDGCSVADDGRLLIKTDIGEISLTAPEAYQIDENGQKRNVEASYRIINESTYGFFIGDYDKDRILIIDPLLAGTSFGTWDYNYLEVNGIDSDSDGNIYVTGMTYSSFPTTLGAYKTEFTAPFYESFISKFDSNLSTLLASTFLGIQSSPSDLKIDNNGNILVCGYAGAGFPVSSDAYQKIYGGGTSNDGFVSILNGSLTDLLYSTYIGGNDYDVVNGIDISSDGSIFIAGQTQSHNFPVTGGSYDTTKNAAVWSDAFIAKFNPELSELLSSTFLGGTQSQFASDIVIDSEDNVYIFGEVYNPGIPGFPTTTGSFQEVSSGGIWDTFISKFDNGLANLEYSTFLGGSSIDSAMEIKINNSGNIVVNGATLSADYPATVGAYNETKNDKYDFFISIIDPTLSSAIASTFLGGADDDGRFYSKSLAIDSGGNIFIAGWSKSNNFPMTQWAYNANPPGWGEYIVVAKMSGNLENLLASTYFGGSGGNEGLVMNIDRDDNVFISGTTIVSPDFPVTEGSYNEFFPADDYEGYLSKFDNNLSGPIVEPTLSASNSIISVSPSPSDAGETVTITITAHDTDDNPYTNGGDSVVISVAGANTVTPSVIDNGDGTYTATYVPAVSGTDQIVASINSVNIGKDNDGISDGIFNLTINANILEPPAIPIIPTVDSPIVQDEDDYLNLIKSEKNSLTFDALISKNKSQKSENISSREDGNTGIKEIEIETENDKKIDDEFKIDKKENQPAKVVLPDEVTEGFCQVYSYFEIDTEISDSSVDEVNIKIRVAKDWLKENSLTDISAYQSKSRGINEKLAVKMLEDSQQNEIIKISSDDLSGYWIIIACGEQLQQEESFIEKPTLITEVPKDEEATIEEVPATNAFQMNNQEEVLLTVAENSVTAEPLAKQIIDYEKVLKIIASVGMLAQMIALATQFRTPVDFMLFLKEALFRIFGILGFRRKSKIDWGTVYDAINGQPLPLTRVNLLDHVSGQLKETKFTDKFGSYYFLVNPGQFQMETFKPGYLISQADNSAKKTLYGDSYGLETLTFKDYGKVVRNIAMMKQQGRNYIRAIFNAETFKIILLIIFYLGLLANLLILIFFPSNINFFIFIVYFYFVFLRHIFTSSVKWGKVIDNNGTAQIFTTIKVRNKENGKLVARTISDEKGRYFLVVNKGDYILEYMNTGEGQKIHTDQISLSQRGSIKKQLIVG